jgi:hypothetical protein
MLIAGSSLILLFYYFMVAFVGVRGDGKEDIGFQYQ